MSVTQENHWACDICGAKQITREVTSPWSDPVVRLPVGWDVLTVPYEYRKSPMQDCCDACPACVSNADWSTYKPALE